MVVDFDYFGFFVVIYSIEFAMDLWWNVQLNFVVSGISDYGGRGGISSTFVLRRFIFSYYKILINSVKVVVLGEDDIFLLAKSWD